jgi:hypothetical protein
VIAQSDSAVKTFQCFKKSRASLPPVLGWIEGSDFVFGRRRIDAQAVTGMTGPEQKRSGSGLKQLVRAAERW